jgi:general stress protein YciG
VTEPRRYQPNRSARPRLAVHYGHHDYHYVCGLLTEGEKMAEERKGEMTVEEAGRKGGQKGGEKVKEKYGPEFYSKIGHKGGQRVKELIKEGEQAEKAKK